MRQYTKRRRLAVRELVHPHEAHEIVEQGHVKILVVRQINEKAMEILRNAGISVHLKEERKAL